MKYFSNKFSSLLENMKSVSPLEEARGKDRTASGDKVDRVNRKKKKYEDKFSDASGKFKTNAFINALELLRDQIMAEVSSMMNTARSGSAGYKYYETNLDSMNSLKNRVLDLLVSTYDKAKKEGGEFEIGKDDVIIRTLRDQYVEIATEYEELSKKWSDDKNKDIEERPVDQSNRELETKIQEIKDLFDEAKLYLTKLNVKGSTGGTGGTGGTGSTGKIEVAETIVQRKAAYTGKQAETIKAVKLLIYNKYKSTKLAEQPDWKIVYKNPSNPGPTLRANTANVIRGVKAGLVKKYTTLSGDTTGNITKAFVEVLTSLKESISIDNNYKIVTFSDFMRNRVNESDDFDVDAAIAAMSKGGSGSSSGSKSSGSKSSSTAPPKFKMDELPKTPFANETEGNKFREWVIKNQGDWAKNNNLDKEGDHNNSYIRKAWKEYGSKYDSELLDSRELSIQEMEDLFTEFKKYNSKSTIDSDKEKRYYVESTISYGTAGYVTAVIYRAGNTDYKYYLPGKFTSFKSYPGTYKKSSKTIKFSLMGAEKDLSDFIECKLNFAEARKMNQAKEISKVAEWLGKDLKWDAEGKRWWVEGYLNVSLDWDTDLSKLFIFFDDQGQFNTGTYTGKIATAIRGTWDKGGRSMTFKGKTYTGDNLKSTLLKVLKAAGGKMTYADGVSAA
jgi:hypothetical protein